MIDPEESPKYRVRLIDSMWKGEYIWLAEYKTIIPFLWLPITYRMDKDKAIEDCKDHQKCNGGIPKKKLFIYSRKI